MMTIVLPNGIPCYSCLLRFAPSPPALRATISHIAPIRHAVTVINGVATVFSGYFLPLYNLPSVFKWLYYASYQQHALSAYVSLCKLSTCPPARPPASLLACRLRLMYTSSPTLTPAVYMWHTRNSLHTSVGC